MRPSSDVETDRTDDGALRLVKHRVMPPDSMFSLTAIENDGLDHWR